MAWFKRLHSFAVSRPLLFLLMCIVVVSLPMVLVPSLDIAVSRLFYVPGVGFAAARAPGLLALRWLGQAITGVVAVFIVVSLVAAMFGRVKFLLPIRPAAFLALSLLLGPALLVNGFMKEFWGRVRPRDILEFGGTLNFTPAWQVYGHCSGNCSFVSGEGSSAIWILAFALVVPRQWRGAAAAWLFDYALVMSLNRLAFGGHFASDILLSWCVTLIVVIACYRFCYWTEYEPVRAGLLRWVVGGYGSARRRVRTLFASNSSAHTST